MRIAIVSEDSQCTKNPMLEGALRRAVEPLGHTVFNYGMYGEDSNPISYVQTGILASVLLNGGAADFVATGCGTGGGAMLSLNSFPGVICGYVTDPLDAFTFAQINGGNAVSVPLALKCGLGQELGLKYTFEKLFSSQLGGGYPAESAASELEARQTLDVVRANNFRPFAELLENLDRDLTRGALSGERLQELFFANARDSAVAAKVREILEL